MRHRKDHRKLNRTPAHRKAMLRNLVTSLLDHEQVRTTDARAKEVRRIAERMITLGKRGTLHAQRKALEPMPEEERTPAERRAAMTGFCCCKTGIRPPWMAEVPKMRE